MFSHYKRDINQRDNSSKACSIKKHYSGSSAPVSHEWWGGGGRGGGGGGTKINYRNNLLKQLNPLGVTAPRVVFFVKRQNF